MPGRKPRIEILAERTFSALHGTESFRKRKVQQFALLQPKNMLSTGSPVVDAVISVVLALGLFGGLFVLALVCWGWRIPN